MELDDCLNLEQTVKILKISPIWLGPILSFQQSYPPISWDIAEVSLIFLASLFDDICDTCDDILMGA
jgi:hypothetical protein